MLLTIKIKINSIIQTKKKMIITIEIMKNLNIKIKSKILLVLIDNW